MIKERLIFLLLFGATLLFPVGACFKLLRDFRQATLLSKACSYALRDLFYQATHIRSGVDFDIHWVRDHLLPLLEGAHQKNITEFFKKEGAEGFFDSSAYSIYTLREPVTLTYLNLQLFMRNITPQGDNTPRIFLLSFVLDNELHDGMTTKIDALKFIIKEFA